MLSREPGLLGGGRGERESILVCSLVQEFGSSGFFFSAFRVEGFRSLGLSGFVLYGFGGRGLGHRGLGV